MEGEEKGEKFHTFLVSDDSGQVSDEIPFASSGSCEEKRVSSLMRGRESLLTEIELWQPWSRTEERKKEEKGSEVLENKIIKKWNGKWTV